MTDTASVSKLLPNQVYVIDDRGLPWIYDISDPDEYEFIQSRAKKDDAGNLVLSLPLIAAALKRWTPEEALERIENEVKEINVPEIKMPTLKELDLDISDLGERTNEELEEMLAVYGGYMAYLESQLSYVESKKGLLESTFEESMSRMMFGLQSQKDKKAVKESLRGEALSVNSKLNQLRKDSIEAEALFVRVLGLRNSYKAIYGAISRVVALRTSGNKDN